MTLSQTKGQNPHMYLQRDQIYHFGRGLSGLQIFEFSFSYRSVGVKKIILHYITLYALPRYIYMYFGETLQSKPIFKVT